MPPRALPGPAADWSAWSAGRGWLRRAARPKPCVAPAPRAPCDPALHAPASRPPPAAPRAPAWAAQDAIRGATYDLLSNRPREHFAHEPPHAFATLSAADRRRVRELLGLPALPEAALTPPAALEPVAA